MTADLSISRNNISQIHSSECLNIYLQKCNSQGCRTLHNIVWNSCRNGSECQHEEKQQVK
jgi:hypothetical protein